MGNENQTDQEGIRIVKREMKILQRIENKKVKQKLVKIKNEKKIRLGNENWEGKRKLNRKKKIRQGNENYVGKRRNLNRVQGKRILDREAKISFPNKIFASLSNIRFP